MVFRDQVPRRRVAFANLAPRDVHSLTLLPFSSNFHSSIVDADVYKDVPPGQDEAELAELEEAGAWCRVDLGEEHWSRDQCRRSRGDGLEHRRQTTPQCSPCSAARSVHAPEQSSLDV